ncbi:MAG: hypothetical protein H5T50_10050 [Nitrososphaeria archaeon]|nr:hypothetical protein [Nitrososphaeria archaeon]
MEVIRMELHLNPLENKIVGVIEFKVETPIHIGSGGTEVRAEFLKVQDKLLIPSTTWKGVFRALSEKIAKAMEFDYIPGLAIKLYHEKERGIEYKPADEIEKKEYNEFEKELKKIYGGNKSEKINLSREDMYQMIDELGFSDLKEQLEKEDKGTWNKFTEAILAINCPIGKLYGNRYLASKIRFFDTLIHKPKVHERPGILIDRKSGKVRKESLYFKEVYAEDNIKLVFIADNLKQGDDDSKIFVSTLNYIKELGIHIGGGISRGLGYLKFENAKFYILNLKEGKFEDRIINLAKPFKHIPPVDIDELSKYLV